MSNSSMWKPGTAKPQSPTAKRKKSPDTHGQKQSSKSVNKKKLSGATMGMRFMQRKMEAEEARRKTLEEKKEQDKMEWTEEPDYSGEGPAEGDESVSYVAQVATPSDMYGLQSDLIGRRSFGGYRPKVKETWNSALHTWKTGKAGDDEAGKQHISDEELLRRYKHYASGKGDLSGHGVDSAAAAPVGNLHNKLKKGQQKKNQSPCKRKR